MTENVRAFVTYPTPSTTAMRRGASTAVSRTRAPVSASTSTTRPESAGVLVSTYSRPPRSTTLCTAASKRPTASAPSRATSPPALPT